MAKLIVSDLDDTLVIGTNGVNEQLAEHLRSKNRDGYEIVIVSGRQNDRLEETRAWLEANNIPHFQVHLSDFPAGPNAATAFKVYKAGKLIEAGHSIIEWWDNDPAAFRELDKIDINVRRTSELEKSNSALEIAAARRSLQDARTRARAKLTETKRARAAKTESQNNPQVRTILVAGPPAAGKSSYIAANRSSGDITIDWDKIAVALDPDATRTQARTLRRIIREMRDAAVHQIALDHATGEKNYTAWLIAGLPKAEDRWDMAKKIGADEVIVITCDLDVARGRIDTDEERSKYAREQMAAVHRWWKEYTKDPRDVAINTSKRDGSKALPDLTPPQAVREEARRGLEWRREYNRGGTTIGVARARDLANGRTLSIDTIGRMISYFARHEVDKQGEGWSPGEDGYPSAGRIAWALWGGDPGRSWAIRMRREWDAENEKHAKPGTGQGQP